MHIARGSYMYRNSPFTRVSSCRGFCDSTQDGEILLPFAVIQYNVFTYFSLILIKDLDVQEICYE